MKLTEKRKQHLADYVREVADLMALKDWDCNVWYDKPEKDETDEHVPNATATVGLHRKVVDITFDPELLEQMPDCDIRQCVVHELVHCHFGEMWHFTRLFLLDHADVTQQFYDLFIATFEGHMEVGVDGMADALAKHMPEFSWPK